MLFILYPLLGNALCKFFIYNISFLLTLFDTWDYYFNSNLSLLMYIKVLLTKKRNIDFYPSKHEETTSQLSLMDLFLC